VLAAVTSLPNAVAAVYLAARGRGAATLSTALNSNTLNVAVGLLLPATVIGLGRPSGQTVLVTVWYVALTLAGLALAWRDRGLGPGSLVIAAHAAFTLSVLAGGYVIPSRAPLVTVLAVLTVGAMAAELILSRRRRQIEAAGMQPVAPRGRDRAPEPPRDAGGLSAVSGNGPPAPGRSSRATRSPASAL